MNQQAVDLSQVVVLSYSRYMRYRTLLKRIESSSEDFMHQAHVQNALICLGIPVQRTQPVNIFFCRSTFKHDELLNHELHLQTLGKLVVIHLYPSVTILFQFSTQAQGS